VIIEITFKRNTAYLSGFSSGKNFTFVQTGSILVKGRNTVSLVIKVSMLEAGRPSIMCP
jgi:hypothetical protein